MNRLVSILLKIFVFLTAYSVKRFNDRVKRAPPRYKQQQQIEIKGEVGQIDNLLSNGTVKNEGWARKAVWDYKREYINAYKVSIKEWDYYATYISELDLWIGLTISDLGYAGLNAIAVIDCKNKKFSQKDEVIPLILGKSNLESNSVKDHKITFENKKSNLNIEITGEKIKDNFLRKITINAPEFILPNGEKGLKLYLEMNQPSSVESMNIQTTWAHNRNLFYLNEKVNGMRPHKGFYKLGNIQKDISEKDLIFTTLDWGRGVWKYSGTWYWSSATGIMKDGMKVGFNLGYGFSDRSTATENVLFVNDKIIKLGDIKFDMPKEEKDFGTQPWRIYSEDEKVDLTFIPDVDRISKMNYLVIKSNQHQVFGTFKGKFNLENDKEIIVENLHGFAEKVFNRW